MITRLHVLLPFSVQVPEGESFTVYSYAEDGYDVRVYVEDTLRVLRAGANTVQLLTGLVYRGPGIARSINRGLVKRMKDRGVASLSDLVQAGDS